MYEYTAIAAPGLTSNDARWHAQKQGLVPHVLAIKDGTVHMFTEEEADRVGIAAWQIACAEQPAPADAPWHLQIRLADAIRTQAASLRNVPNLLDPPSTTMTNLELSNQVRRLVTVVEAQNQFMLRLARALYLEIQGDD